MKITHGNDCLSRYKVIERFLAILKRLAFAWRRSGCWMYHKIRHHRGQCRTSARFASQDRQITLKTLLNKSSINKGRFIQLRMICLEKQNLYRVFSIHADFEWKRGRVFETSLNVLIMTLSSARALWRLINFSDFNGVIPKKIFLSGQTVNVVSFIEM